MLTNSHRGKIAHKIPIVEKIRPRNSHRGGSSWNSHRNRPRITTEFASWKRKKNCPWNSHCGDEGKEKSLKGFELLASCRTKDAYGTHKAAHQRRTKLIAGAKKHFS